MSFIIDFTSHFRYRAKVEKVSGSQVYVFYMDYGNVSNVGSALGQCESLPFSLQHHIGQVNWLPLHSWQRFWLSHITATQPCSDSVSLSIKCNVFYRWNKRPSLKMTFMISWLVSVKTILESCSKLWGSIQCKNFYIPVPMSYNDCLFFQREITDNTKLAALPTAFVGLAPQAHEFFMACINLPSEVNCWFHFRVQYVYETFLGWNSS